MPATLTAPKTSSKATDLHILRHAAEAGRTRCEAALSSLGRKAGIEADALQQGRDPARTLGTWRDVVDAQGIVQHARDSGAGIEGGQRILEHHLQFCTHAAQGCTTLGKQVCSIEGDGAGIGLDQAQDRAGERRLAAAGGADQSQRLAGPQREADVVEGGDRYAGAAEPLGQALDLEQRRAHAPTPRCASMSERV